MPALPVWPSDTPSRSPTLCRRGLLRLEVADQPACDDDLALAREEVVRERDRAGAFNLGLEVVLALGDRVEPRDRPRLPELGLVVVRLVLEEQRHDPLRDQVAAVGPLQTPLRQPSGPAVPRPERHRRPAPAP